MKGLQSDVVTYILYLCNFVNDVIFCRNFGVCYELLVDYVCYARVCV